MMLGLNFNSGKNPWPSDTCHARRCTKPPAWRFPDVPLWANQDPRDVLLCVKHTEIAMAAHETDQQMLPPGEPIPEAHGLVPAPAPAPAPAPEQELVVQTPMEKLKAFVTEWSQGKSEALAASLPELQEDLEAVRGFDIVTREEAAVAASSLKDVKDTIKEMEEDRKANTQPLNGVKRIIDSWYKPSKDVLNETKDLLSEKLKADRTAQAALQAAFTAEAQAAERPEDIRDALVAAADAQGAVQGVTYIDRWVFQVEEPQAVPPEFWSPDPKKIDAFVKEHKDKAVIPGVKIWNDPIVRS